MYYIIKSDSTYSEGSESPAQIHMQVTVLAFVPIINTIFAIGIPVYLIFYFIIYKPIIYFSKKLYPEWTPEQVENSNPSLVRILQAQQDSMEPAPEPEPKPLIPIVNRSEILDI